MPATSELANRFALPAHLQAEIDPLPRTQRLDVLGSYIFSNAAVPTPAVKGAMKAFIREAGVGHVEELVRRAATDSQRKALPFALHTMAVRPGKIAVALKQVDYNHKQIAKTLFALVPVRQFQSSTRGKVARFNEMASQGKVIISALHEAGFKANVQVAEALHHAGFEPVEIVQNMFNAGYNRVHVVNALKRLSGIDVPSTLYSAFSGSKTPKERFRAAAIVAKTLYEVGGANQGDIAKSLAREGHGAKEVALHLLKATRRNGRELADALHGAGYSPTDLAQAMMRAGNSSTEVAAQLKRLSPAGISDVLYTALTREKYNGKGIEQALFNEFAAALKHVNFSHVAIASVLRQKVRAGNRIVDALKSVGFTNSRDIVEALKKSGYSDFETAVYMFGAFTPQQVSQGFYANGARYIPKTMHKALQAVKYLAHPDAAKLCKELASALKPIGYDHREISRELRDLGYDGNVITPALRDNGFKPPEVARALHHVKYGSNDIAHYMLSSGYSPAQVAVELNSLSLPNIGAALHHALVKKYGDDKIQQVSAITAGALNELGLGHFAISESLATAGHGHNVIGASLKSIGVRDAHGVSQPLYRAGFSNSQVAESLLSNKFSPVEAAVELHRNGVTYGEIQRALAKQGVSGRQIRDALDAIGFSK